MTAAQQRSRDLNRRIERTDRWFLVLISSAALLITVAVFLIFFQILQVNSRLETQVQENRKATQQAIDEIKSENERVHREEVSLLKCIALLQMSQRTKVAIDDCVTTAESEPMSSPLNSIPTAPSESVTNATPTQKMSEQPKSQQPVATAPPDPRAPKIPFFSGLFKALGL